jgi:hypothetical protein
VDYTHLSERDAFQLRHERILSLESQHFRIGLALEEDPENAQALKDLRDLESRIEFQRAMVGMVVPPDQGAADGPDTPGSDDAAGLPRPVGDPVAMTTDTNTSSDERPEGLETKSVDPEFQHADAEGTAEQPEGDAQGDTAESGTEDGTDTGTGDGPQTVTV